MCLECGAKFLPPPGPGHQIYLVYDMVAVVSIFDVGGLCESAIFGGLPRIFLSEVWSSFYTELSCPSFKEVPCQTIHLFIIPIFIYINRIVSMLA